MKTFFCGVESLPFVSFFVKKVEFPGENSACFPIVCLSHKICKTVLAMNPASIHQHAIPEDSTFIVQEESPSDSRLDPY